MLLQFTDCVSSVIFFSKQDCPFFPHSMLFFLNLLVSDLLKPIPVSQKNKVYSSTSTYFRVCLSFSHSLPSAHARISDSASLSQLVVAFMTSISKLLQSHKIILHKPSERPRQVYFPACYSSGFLLTGKKIRDGQGKHIIIPF